MQNYRAGDKICLFGAWALRSSLPPNEIQRAKTKYCHATQFVIPNQDSLVGLIPHVPWLGYSTR